MNKKTKEKIQEEIKKLSVDAVKKMITDIEKEMSQKSKEFAELFKNAKNKKEILEKRNEIAKLMYKKELLEKKLDEEDPVNIVQRERNEFKKRAKKIVKEVATGKRQVDSYMLRMLLVHSVGLVPYLEGETGIGKSARIREYADLMGMKYVKVMLTGKEKVHIEGNIIPEIIERGEDPDVDAKIDTINKYVESGEKSSTQGKRNSLLIHKNTIPEFLNQVLNALSKGEHVLLHFDEFLRADREVFNTIMDFILENQVEAFQGRLKTGRLHKVASGNPPDIYDGVELDPAQKQRFIFMNVKVNYTEFFKITAPKIGMHPFVIEFLQEHTNLFHTAEKHREKNGMEAGADNFYIGLNARKWTMISDILKTYEEMFMDDPDTKVLMLNIMEEVLLEDAASYGEKETIKLFITKYKSEDKLTLKKIKTTLIPYYEDLYFVESEDDKETKPLEQIFATVDNMFKIYNVGTQLDNNKKMLLLQDAFNEFDVKFIQEYDLKDKDEDKIREDLKDAINKDASSIIPFLAILNATGEAGIKTIQQKFDAMGLKNEGIDFLDAVGNLFNTNFLEKYAALSLDATDQKDLKKSLEDESFFDNLLEIDTLINSDFDIDSDDNSNSNDINKK